MACLYIVFFTLFYSAVDAQPNYCELPCNLTLHTVCLRNYVDCGASENCGSHYNPIYVDERVILDVHNELRNKVATGLEINGKQPSASNMNALSYSSELGSIAQCWTDNCVFAHDKCRRTEEYDYIGQNIALKIGTPVSELNSQSDIFEDHINIINSTINEWYNEVKDYDASWISSFDDNKEKNVSQYTQIVWAETKIVGCGITGYNDNGINKLFIACNYGPGGNVKGQPVYKLGKPASECSELLPNENYPGLCGDDILE